MQTKGIKEKPFEFALIYVLHTCPLLQLPQIIVFFHQRIRESEEPPWHFKPTSHTCSNSLNLPRVNAVLPLPTDNELFEMFDLAAFENNYFGIV